MLSSFLAWLRVVVLVAVIGMPARAQQNEINASPEQTTEQQGLDPNPLRRTTLTFHCVGCIYDRVEVAK